MIAMMSSLVRVVDGAGDGQVQLRIHPVPADIAEVVAFLVEEEPFEEVFRRFEVGRFA